MKELIPGVQSALGINYELEYTYSKLLNAVIVHAKCVNIPKIFALDCVKTAFVDVFLNYSYRYHILPGILQRISAAQYIFVKLRYRRNRSA